MQLFFRRSSVYNVLQAGHVPCGVLSCLQIAVGLFRGCSLLLAVGRLC